MILILPCSSESERKEKKRIVDKKYRLLHKEEIRQRLQQYYLNNKEKFKEYKLTKAPRVNVICTECHRPFERLLYEFNRTEREGGNHFCDSSCQSKYFNKHLTEEQKERRNSMIKKNRYILKSDDLSPFKIFSKRVRQADVVKRYGQSDIDPEYLKQLWDSQNGKCGYTGIKMILPPTIREYHKTHSIKKISLDRIDSSRGYLKGNVHFTCQAINLAKRNLPHDEMIEFVKEIKNAGNIPAFNKNGGPAGERSQVSEIIDS